MVNKETVSVAFYSPVSRTDPSRESPNQFTTMQARQEEKLGSPIARKISKSGDRSADRSDRSQAVRRDPTRHPSAQTVDQCSLVRRKDVGLNPIGRLEVAATLEPGGLLLKHSKPPV